MNIIDLYRIAKVKRGRHTSAEEKFEDTSNNKIVESFILSYSQFSGKLEDILSGNTILNDNLERVFIDLFGKYRNSRVEADTIIIPINHNNKIPRIVTFREKEKFKNLIFADDLIYIKPDKDLIDSKYLFYVMQTQAIINKLNEEKKLSCRKVEEVTIKLPSMERQLEIVKQLDLIGSKKVELDKQEKNILEKLI